MVLDPSSAGIPAAKVTLESVATGLRLEATSDASGEYRFILGSWKSHSGEVSRQGRCITIWKRTGTGAWEIETETGFEF